MGDVLHFPVQQAMPSRVAEEKLGQFVIFSYPVVRDCSIEEWARDWLMGKPVLLGWEATRNGIAHGFRNDKVRHIISDVYISKGKNGLRRPVVKIGCSRSRYPIFNWQSDDSIKRVPVILLSVDQEKYFRMCQRCRKNGRKIISGSR